MCGLGQLSGTVTEPLQKLLAINTKVLSGTGTVVVPVFRVTGVAKVLKLWGVIASTLGNHTNAHFRLNDGTITVPVSKVTTTTLTGFGAGSPFYRAGLAGDALLAASAAACGIIDPTNKGELISTEMVLVAKNGITTTLEYVFTTTDPATTGSITFFAEFQSRSNAALLTPV